MMITGSSCPSPSVRQHGSAHTLPIGGADPGLLGQASGREAKERRRPRPRVSEFGGRYLDSGKSSDLVERDGGTLVTPRFP